MGVEDGGDTGPFTTGGVCYELQVGGGNDSVFNMDTTGVDFLVIFAQHVPIEFERDMHYFKDSSGNDIEPVVEESSGHHHHDHDHGDEGESLGITCGCATAD